MKKFFTTALLLCCAAAVWSQQEEQYTQFMHYKQGFNPAFVGSTPGVNLAALVRSQWLGLDGAPQTQLLTLSMPFANNRVGVGANVLRQTIGVSENYTIDASYAYHLPLGNGYLGLGLQASVRLLRVNFSRLRGTQPIDTDGAIPNDFQSRYVPNFGAGIYYHKGDRVFFGFSIPRILQSNIDLADSRDIISKEVRHYYMMGGFTADLNEDKLQIQPQVLLKYVPGAPFDADVNVNFIFNKKFYAGASYRLGGNKNNSLGESVSLLLSADVTENIMFGMSYDMTLSELRNYNSGTIEGVVRYFFSGKSKGTDVDAPRGPKFF